MKDPDVMVEGAVLSVDRRDSSWFVFRIDGPMMWSPDADPEYVATFDSSLTTTNIHLGGSQPSLSRYYGAVILEMLEAIGTPVDQQRNVLSLLNLVGQSFHLSGALIPTQSQGLQRNPRTRYYLRWSWRPLIFS